ncbi:MAG TPA: PAS domain S-box protein [bacterium]|nr:PAS domain S-box protein [bacterium]
MRHSASLPHDTTRTTLDRCRRDTRTLRLNCALISIFATIGLTLVGNFFHVPRSGLLLIYLSLISVLAYVGGHLVGLVTASLSILLVSFLIVPPPRSLALTDMSVLTHAVFVLGALFAALSLGYKRDADARRRQNERTFLHLAAIVESSDDAIFSKTLDAIILSWNTGAERLYGYAPHEILGRPVSVLVPPEQPNEIPALMARLKRGERIEGYETVRVKKNGSRVDVSLTISPVKDALGRIIGASTIARDISHTKQIEKQLHAQADLLNITYDAIFTWEVEGTILYWNRGAEDLYGFAPEEAVGRVSHELLRTEYPDGTSAYIQALSKTGRWEGELHQVTRHGRKVIVDSRAILTERDGRRFVLETNRDITERKQAEARRRRLQEHDRLLHAVAAAISGQTELQQMLIAVLDHLRPVVRLTGGSIILREGDDLVLRAAAGSFSAQALGQRVPRGPSRVWQVVDRGEPFLSADLLAEGLTPTTPLRSYLAVPLLGAGLPFGILEINSTEPHAFATVDMDLMRHVASILSGSIELALRYAAEEQAKAEAEEARRAERVAREAAERAADRIERLQAITAALSEATTLEQVADVIVVNALQALGGDAASLSLLEPDESTLELVRAVGYPSEIVQRWRRFPLDRVPGIAAAMRTGLVVWDGTEDDLATRYADHETQPVALRGGGRAVIPLISQRRAVGALYLNFREPRRFGSDDLEFMLTLGRQCAQAIERARLFAREHRVADTLQRALLPAALPQFPGIAVHATHRSGGAREADIGGDWYDAFQLPNGHIGLSIGDVTGRGLRAAVIMGQLRQSIRTAALEHANPATVLQRVAEVLTMTEGDEAMATALFAVIDPATSTLAYATAGHPAPILVGRDLSAKLPACGGGPLGYLGMELPPFQTLQLPPGSLLVLYTDGLTENDRDPIAGEAALVAAAGQELAEPSENHAEAIVRRLLSGVPLRDDVAVITVAVRATPLDRFEMALEAAPRSAVLIRQALRRLMADAGFDHDRAAAITVAVGEAVNNVIEHAYGTTTGLVHIAARRDGSMLRIDVADDGRWRPGRPADGSGYGLGVMKALVDTVEVETTLAGTTVRLWSAVADRRHVVDVEPRTVRRLGE